MGNKRKKEAREVILHKKRSLMKRREREGVDKGKNRRRLKISKGKRRIFQMLNISKRESGLRKANEEN